jgi:hypothetical protein
VSRFIHLENRQGLLRLPHPKQLERDTEPLAMLCKGGEAKDKRDEQCEKLEGVDALNKGVVTTWDTRDVPVPPRPARGKATFKSWDK